MNGLRSKGQFRSLSLVKFKHADQGSVLIMFSFMVLALFGIAGLALDVSRALSAKDTLQQDLDRATLHVGKLMVSAGDDANFNPKREAQLFLDRLDRNSHAKGQAKIVDISAAGGIVQASATARVKTTIMRLFGYDRLDVDVDAAVEVGDSPIDLAMVLDVTGSMAGTKIESLKAAATELLTTTYDLPNAATNVRMSIVPFALYANVGTAHRNESWISVPPDSSRTENRCYTTYPDASSSNCRTETRTGTNDGVPYTYDVNVCDRVLGDPVTECNDVQVNEVWNGCAGSRSYPLNVRDEAYSTQVPGIQNVTCGEPLTPLSSDKDTLSSAIDALSASGETYIPSGLVWGWRTLSNIAPFDEAAAPTGTRGAPPKKYLVLMTDGANTFAPDASTGAHTLNDPITANSLTAELCTNIKAAGIEIYTVAFEVTDITAKDLMRDCASSPGNFFEATGSEQLIAAFSSIGEAFGRLRLTR